jgi:hypothetical protein
MDRQDQEGGVDDHHNDPTERDITARQESQWEDSPHQLHSRGEGVGVGVQLDHILEVHSPVPPKTKRNRWRFKEESGETESERE